MVEEIETRARWKCVVAAASVAGAGKKSKYIYNKKYNLKVHKVKVEFIYIAPYNNSANQNAGPKYLKILSRTQLYRLD